jgi:SAM-dependent methyltransferase
MCDSRGPHRLLIVREMMFGTRDKFNYFLCRTCGTLQIEDLLPDEILMSYYGPGYYSFERQGGSAVSRWMRTQRDRKQLGVTNNIVGQMLAHLKPERIVGVLGQLGLQRNAAILDVGAGSGFLLDRLAKAGFTKLLGIDPFVASDTMTSGGVPIRKCSIQHVSGNFDLVMFNHALEHVADPIAVLSAARKLLAPGGICLVRIPTTSGEAWDVYGANWVQIDAPRHIVVPSREGMAYGAKAAGLIIEREIDDSDSFQFTGSERYKNDIPLHDPAGEALFDAITLKRFEQRAKALNEQGRGDQTSFVMRARSR